MPAPIPNYVHRARLARSDEIPPRAMPVHDGDTFYLRIDLGTYSGVRIDPVVEIRLKGIDVYEISQPHGKEARNFVTNELFVGPVTVQTEKPLGGSDKTFTRTVGQVWIGSEDLVDLLRQNGFEKVLT